MPQLAAAVFPPIPRALRRDPHAERATRTLIRWLTILLFAVVALWGSWFMAEMTIKQRAWNQLLEEGIVTSAEITNVFTENGSRGGQQRQRFAYRYQAENGPQDAESRIVLANMVPRLGEAFKVTYLRAVPTTHVIGDVTAGENNLAPASFHYQYDQLVPFLAVAGIFVTLLAVVIAVFVLPVILSRYRALNREEKLVRHGSAADATIVDCQPDRTVKTLFVVKYQFQPTNGGMVTGSSYIQQSTVEEDRIQAGSTLPILYDANQPAVHILLRDLSFVEMLYS